jgi:hypothetical protein
MNYQNKLGAFENSVEESKNQLNNFTNRRDEIVGDNKKLLSSAKALQSSDLIQGVISNMSGVVGMKSLKEVGSKGLSWVDKKLGGKIAKDTKGFKDGLKKVGKQAVKKYTGVDLDDVSPENLKNKVIGKKAGNEQVEGDETKSQSVSDDKVDRISESKGEVARSGETEGKGNDGDSTPDDPEPTRGRPGQQVEDYEGDFEGVPDDFNIDGDILSKTNLFTEDTLDEGVERRRMGQEDFDVNTEGETKADSVFEKGADEDVSTENKFEEATKAVNAENTNIDKANKADGGDADEDPDVDPEADADDTGKALAKGAGNTLADEEAGDALLESGGVLDATGVGAIIGVPLEIAGAITDLVGVVEAGKSFGDWFNEDVLGNKPPVNAQHIALPKAPSTLASQGFQATPSYSSAVDISGGAGGW